MCFPFLTSQIQSQTIAPQLLVSNTFSPALIAKEEEIHQFFDHYAALYKRKDVDGFLALFSSKALQNHKDGIEEIRRIYTDFFNQSDELRYRMKGKIEIYQNAIEVKGFYEIDQLTKKGKRKVWTGSVQWVLTREDGVLKIISVNYQPDKSP
jgi:ketosteroid isomerase-like protein